MGIMASGVLLVKFFYAKQNHLGAMMQKRGANQKQVQLFRDVI